MKEKLQEYALIAEIISAIAIVLSLIFVGLQVRQGAEETAANTEAIRSSVRESMLTTDINMLQNMIDDPELFADFFFDSNFDAVAIRRTGFFTQFIRSREHYWLQYKSGFLSKESFDSYMATLLFNFRKRQVLRDMWEDNASNGSYAPEFVAYVNEQLQDVE